MLMHQDMGIGDVCSIMLDDLRQLYLCSYSRHAARAALVTQVSCSLVVCTALVMQKQIQTCNQTTPLHICITSVARCIAALLYLDVVSCKMVKITPQKGMQKCGHLLVNLGGKPGT